MVVAPSVTKTLSATELAVRSGTKTKDPFCSGVHWMNINAMGSYHILLSNHINTLHTSCLLQLFNNVILVIVSFYFHE